MDSHIDREIRLSEESEFRTLYSWFLQEFTTDGKGDSSKPIPWEWSFNFTASAISYQKNIELEKSENDYPVRSGSESINATLQPTSSDGFGPHFSMFGTNRRIHKFYLGVYRLKDDREPEHCRAWGSVSYTTEIDFHEETEEDELGFEITLHSRNFDDLRELVRTRSTDDLLHVRVSGVSGFYSDWSPSISTNFVKVLTSEKEQKIIKPEGCAIDPPRLGSVRRFALSFRRRVLLSAPKGAEPDETAETVAAQTAEPSEEAVRKEQYDAMLLARLVHAQQGLDKLRVPLWIVVFLLVAVLLFK
jgi:hypothetical protein